MKIQITAMNKFYYKSDFSIEIPVSADEFEIVFFTDKRAFYLVSKKEGVCTNCVHEDGQSICKIMFDSHGLAPGIVKYVISYSESDNKFADGTFDLKEAVVTKYSLTRDVRYIVEDTRDDLVTNSQLEQKLLSELDKYATTEELSDELQNFYKIADATYMKKEEYREFDSTEIIGRLEVLEAKEDKDTIYDDSELRSKIDIQGATIDALGNLINDVGKEYTNLQNRIYTLENKEDKDTIYDDSELRETVNQISEELGNIDSVLNEIIGA